MKIEVGSINENMDGGTTFSEQRYTGMRATTKYKRTIRDQRRLEIDDSQRTVLQFTERRSERGSRLCQQKHVPIPTG